MLEAKDLMQTLDSVKTQFNAFNAKICFKISKGELQMTNVKFDGAYDTTSQMLQQMHKARQVGLLPQFSEDNKKKLEEVIEKKTLPDFSSGGLF